MDGGNVVNPEQQPPSGTIRRFAFQYLDCSPEFLIINLIRIGRVFSSGKI